MIDGLPPEFASPHVELLTRTRATLNSVQERLEDPVVGNVVSDGALNNGHSWVQSMVNELQSALAQGNPGLIGPNTGFYGNLEALSQNLSQFPSSNPTGALSSLLDEASSRLGTMRELQLQQEAAARANLDQQQRILEEARQAKEEGLKRLGEQEVAAGRLLAALGAEATSSGYAATAKQEKAQADWWRRITLAGGGATAILAVVLFLTVNQQGLESIATRVGVILPAILLTVYAGRQSTGHRTQEREARRLQLAFGSVDAYLADLTTERRSELKTLLSSRLFGTADGFAQVPADYPSSADLVGLLSEAINRLR